MEFAAVVNEQKVNWYSTDLIEQLITEKIVESAVLDEQTVAFIRDNIQKILGLLSKEKINLQRVNFVVLSGHVRNECLDNLGREDAELIDGKMSGL